MTTARRARVHGTVQGVGFRGGCVRAAASAGAGGWIRNLPDGSVEVHVEGDTAAVEQVLTWLHVGARPAHVTAVDITAADVRGYTEFVVR